MGLFESFRDKGWNTYYTEMHFGASVDLTLVTVTYTAAVLFIVMLMIVIGTRGQQRWSTFFRLLLSLHTGIVIIVCIFGRFWQDSQVHSHSEYSAGVRDDVIADVGIHIGLKHVNITLQANNDSTLLSWIINYNEEFSFDHVNDLKANFHDALTRGFPRPILYTLEYFYVDAGGFRWSRALRTAGHFTHIILWTSFVTWLMSNVLVCFVVFRGLAFLALTGCLMSTSTIVYHFMQYSAPIIIPFEDGLLRLHYGWCFYLCLSSGLFSFIVGVILMTVHWRSPDSTNNLFLIDTSFDEDDIERYSYSPGPLKIDTPFSRRSERIFQESRGLINTAFVPDKITCTNTRDFREHMTTSASSLSSVSLKLHPEIAETCMDASSHIIAKDHRYKLCSTDLSVTNPETVVFTRRNSASSWLYFPAACRYDTDILASHKAIHSLESASVDDDFNNLHRCRDRVKSSTQQITTFAVIESCSRPSKSDPIRMCNLGNGNHTVKDPSTVVNHNLVSRRRGTCPLLRTSSLPSSADRLAYNIEPSQDLQSHNLTSSLDPRGFKNRVLNLKSDKDVNASDESIC